MNNYEKRTLKKKEAIIDSALALFGRQGFSNVSIKDIASSAKVSQVSIYNYFGSKESLVQECAKVIMNDTIKLAEDILDSDLTFTKKIEKALSLCNSQINISLAKYLSAKALDDTQFVNLVTKDINSLKKEIYMKYVTHGKQEKIISDISDDAIQLFIDAINSIGSSIPEVEMEERQSEIVRLFLYGLIGTPTKSL